jgi:hypothetical protein
MAKVTESIKIYNILRAKQGVFSDEEAQIIAGALDRKDNVATKEDLAGLELRIEKALSNIRLTDIVLWLVTIGAVVLTNPKALDVITRLFGLAR